METERNRRDYLKENRMRERTERSERERGEVRKRGSGCDGSERKAL